MKIPTSTLDRFAASTGLPVGQNERQKAEATTSLASLLAQRRRRTWSASGTRQSSRQAALDKAARLKQRLEMLKSLLLFASPKMAKAIALQLKSIAHELASLGHAAGGSSAASEADNTDAANVAAAGEMAAPPDGGQVAGAASAPMPEETDTGDASTATDAVSATDGTEEDAADNIEGGGSEDATLAPPGSDDALRQTIAEAKKLLKQLIELVRAKLRADDAQARHALQAAERSLGTLEGTVTAAAGSGLYTALGDIATASTAVADVGATGISIDVHA